MTIGHKAGHYCHFRVLAEWRKKKEEESPSTWRCQGWGTELHLGGVRSSPWLCEGRRCCFCSLCGSWSVGTGGCDGFFFHLHARVRSGHLTNAWPVLILYSMVRRLCCRVYHYSCWSMSPTHEVFRCLFSTKRRVHERENIELLLNSMEHFYSCEILQWHNYSVPKCRRGKSDNRETRNVVCRANTPWQELGQGCEVLRQVNYCECVRSWVHPRTQAHIHNTQNKNIHARVYRERERERLID